MEKNIPVSYKISSSSVFDGPPPKRFANLSEKELNRLVEQNVICDDLKLA